MLKLLLVDDHELIRAGLKQVLQAGLGNIIVGEAKNAEQAMSLVTQQAWDLAITDITMPGRSGLDLLRGVQKSAPRNARVGPECFV